MSLSALLQHHARRIVNDTKRPNVLMNCHARGIHSTMLHDEPGNRMRLFYAGDQHTLWRNHPDTLDDNMTLSVHPHHCDLSLVRIFGEAHNIIGRVRETKNGKFHECSYSSAILGGKGSLDPTGRKFDFVVIENRPLPNHGLAMASTELHTIYVPQGKAAAWLVLEGTPDPDYRPICYTANPEFSMEGMYEHGGWCEAVAMLRACVTRLRLEAEAVAA